MRLFVLCDKMSVFMCNRIIYSLVNVFNSCCAAKFYQLCIALTKVEEAKFPLNIYYAKHFFSVGFSVGILAYRTTYSCIVTVRACEWENQCHFLWLLSLSCSRQHFNKKQYLNLFFKEFEEEKENASSLVLMHPKPGPNIAFSLWLNLKIPIEDSEGIAEFNREKTSVVSVLSPSQNKLS